MYTAASMIVLERVSAVPKDADREGVTSESPPGVIGTGVFPAVEEEGGGGAVAAVYSRSAAAQDEALEDVAEEVATDPRRLRPTFVGSAFFARAAFKFVALETAPTVAVFPSSCFLAMERVVTGIMRMMLLFLKRWLKLLSLENTSRRYNGLPPFPCLLT